MILVLVAMVQKLVYVLFFIVSLTPPILRFRFRRHFCLGKEQNSCDESSKPLILCGFPGLALL